MLEEAITSGEIGEQSYTGYTVFFFHPWIFMSNIKEINRNNNSSFIRFRRWTSLITDVVWSTEMPSFDYLKHVYVIFIQQMWYRIKTRITKGYK